MRLLFGSSFVIVVALFCRLLLSIISFLLLFIYLAARACVRLRSSLSEAAYAGCIAACMF